MMYATYRAKQYPLVPRRRPKRGWWRCYTRLIALVSVVSCSWRSQRADRHVTELRCRRRSESARDGAGARLAPLALHSAISRVSDAPR